MQKTATNVMIDTDDIAPLRVYFESRNITISGTVNYPLFKTKDVATYIDDVNYARTVMGYDKRYATKMYCKDPNGKSRVTYFLTERGLYKYLLQSHRPKAEEFQEWVFDLLSDLRIRTIDATKLAAKIAEDRARAATKDIESLELEMSICSERLINMRSNINDMSLLTYDSYSDDACYRGFADFHIGRYLLRRGSVSSRSSIPRAVVDEVYSLASEYFRCPDEWIMDSKVEELLDDLDL